MNMVCDEIVLKEKKMMIIIVVFYSILVDELNRPTNRDDRNKKRESVPSSIPRQPSSQSDDFQSSRIDLFSSRRT